MKTILILFISTVTIVFNTNAQQSNQKARVQHLQSDLNLSKEQSKALDDFLLDYKSKVSKVLADKNLESSIRQSKMVELSNWREQMFKSLLSDAQIKKLKELSYQKNSNQIKARDDLKKVDSLKVKKSNK